MVNTRPATRQDPSGSCHAMCSDAREAYPTSCKMGSMSAGRPNGWWKVAPWAPPGTAPALVFPQPGGWYGYFCLPSRCGCGRVPAPWGCLKKFGGGGCLREGLLYAPWRLCFGTPKARMYSILLFECTEGNTSALSYAPTLFDYAQSRDERGMSTDMLKNPVRRKATSRPVACCEICSRVK